MTTTPQQDMAPRFALGQRVRVISNHGGLYAAQIGVVGAITKQRQKRRYGYRSYDVTYANARGAEKIVIVREDDLEAVAGTADAAIPEQLADTPAAAATLFRIGQRVTVHPPADGLEDEYPSFTRYPVVGEIASACQVTHGGVHCYDVRFPRIERGVSTESWPPVSIREAHLVPEPSPVGWMAHEAAMARTKKASAKASEKPPSFSVGEHVRVDPQSVLAYETWTRKGAVGAVGEITEIGKPRLGIRRYIVRYPTGNMTRIREEHLQRVEPKSEVSAPVEEPQQDAKPRHACEYRRERREQSLRVEEPLWCDKGGCFEDDCVVCQQTPEWRVRHGLKPPQRRRRQVPHPPAAPAESAVALEQMSLWGCEAHV